MPKKTSPRYGIAYGWTLGEGPWNTDMDANLKLLDVLIGGGTVISDSIATPPGSPAAGDCYIVGASGTGAWLGKDGQVTAYIDGAWLFVVPKRGMRMEVQSASGFKYFNGTTWAAEFSLKTLPCFSSTLSADAVIPTAGTSMTVAFDGVTFDATGDFDVSTHRFTPRVAGKYLVRSQFWINGTSLLSTTAQILKNGTLVAGSSVPVYTSSYGMATCDRIVPMNGTTDYLEGAVMFGGSSATILHNATYTIFEASYVGP